MRIRWVRWDACWDADGEFIKWFSILIFILGFELRSQEEQSLLVQNEERWAGKLTYAALRFHLHWTQNSIVIWGSGTFAIPMGFDSSVVMDAMLYKVVLVSYLWGGLDAPIWSILLLWQIGGNYGNRRILKTWARQVREVRRRRVKFLLATTVHKSGNLLKFLDTVFISGNSSARSNEDKII